MLFSQLRTLFGSRSEPQAPPTALPPGERVYAVGDIHGRADLFAQMIAKIEADDAARPAAATTVILLGDLVDRGPDSAGVIAMARAWMARRRVRILAGNHEEMFVNALTDEGVLRHFLRFGGRETLLSYPIGVDEYDAADYDEIHALMRARVPAADFAFIAAMEDMIVIGDYVFVHAGIRPGVALDAQATSDLRWIRAEFLEDKAPRAFAVVHGHTITPEPQVEPRRIGIDTGAFASNVLTAIGLQGTDRWLIQAGSAGDSTDHS